MPSSAPPARFPVSPEEIAAVLSPLDRAKGLPRAAYEEDSVLAHERAVIFDRAWQCVARDEDLRHPGEWIQALAAPGIVVVRGADLELRAFHNLCRHRGTPLVDAPCGRSQELVCPYHGWTYELTGRRRGALTRDVDALVPVRVATWQGFVFVAGREAPSLEDFLAGAPPWLEEAPLGEAVRARSVDYEVAANWKLLAENFQESHHFPGVHPALEALTRTEEARSHLTEGQWLGGTMELAEGVETVSESRRRSGRPFLAPPGYRRQVSDAMLFPSLLTSLQPDYFLTYRLLPLTPTRTHVVAETFVHPAARGASFDAGDLTRFWDLVNAQDRSICERQQVGIRSPAFRPSRYEPVEEGVHAFDRRVARAYLT